jgi:hypothetical protein
MRVKEGIMKDSEQTDKSKLGKAIGRDAAQTKHDVTGGHKGQDLDQNVKDTIKQSTGRQPIPPKNIPNTKK